MKQQCSEFKKGLHKNVIFCAIMRWVEPNCQWFMYNARDEKFIMNFLDTENMLKVFPRINKSKCNKYEMQIKQYKTSEKAASQ